VQIHQVAPQHSAAVESFPVRAKRAAEQQCSVAEVTRVLGDRWAILIMREAFYGRTRFDEFEKLLGMAPNILSSRLKALLGCGVLERRPCASGKRQSYLLTEKGRAFFPVYIALKSWADEWSGGGESTRLYDAKTGQAIQSAPLVRADGSEISCEDLIVWDQAQARDAT
jgi:DNA-binding HxlR family transcriptional regulator